MQRWMANVSGKAGLNLRGSTRRRAALLNESGGSSKLGGQHAVGGLGGVAPVKSSIRCGSAGVLGGMLQREHLLIQVLDLNLHATLPAPKLGLPVLNKILEGRLMGVNFAGLLAFGPQGGLVLGQTAVGLLKLAP